MSRLTIFDYSDYENISKKYDLILNFSCFLAVRQVPTGMPLVIQYYSDGHAQYMNISLKDSNAAIVKWTNSFAIVW